MPVSKMHPSHLLRTSRDSVEFTAPRNIDLGLNNYDCGIVSLPWLAHRLKLHKYNTISVFLTLFAFLGFLHGCCTSYFTGTSSIWRDNYKLSEIHVEWIAYASPIIGGLFAIPVAYWGNRIHRVTWLGGLAMFQSVAGWILLLPEIHHPHFDHLNSSLVLPDQQLCRQMSLETHPLVFTDDKRYIALSFMYVYQMFHAFAYVSLVTHGLSYIDDHFIKKIRSLRAICLLIGIHEVGKYIGISLTLFPYLFEWLIFLSPVWLITMSLLFIFGFLISLFPKVMLSLVVRRGVDTLLSRSTESIPCEKPIDFMSSLKSIFTAVLLLNAFSSAFMTSALTNFQALGEDFFKARFLEVSENIYAFESFTNYIIKLSIQCVLIIVLAIVITKYKPKIRILILWIAVAYGLVALLFSSYAFIECEDKITMEYKTLIKSCNYQCNCYAEIFAPVCGQGKTYYSACYAGCTQKQDNIYRGCSCIDSSEATEGSCNSHKCFSLWIFSEANKAITSGLSLSTTTLHLLLILRSTKIMETKAMALGFFLTCNQLLPFIPLKFLFDALKDWACIHSKLHGECTSFKDEFVTYLSVLTVSLMIVSIACTLLLMIYARDLDLYKGVTDKHNTENRTASLHDSSSDSLEDVGDPLKSPETLLATQRPRRPTSVTYYETTI